MRGFGGGLPEGGEDWRLLVAAVFCVTATRFHGFEGAGDEVPGVSPPGYVCASAPGFWKVRAKSWVPEYGMIVHGASLRGWGWRGGSV